jgi:hypothetical protein
MNIPFIKNQASSGTFFGDLDYQTETTPKDFGSSKDNLISTGSSIK